MAIDHRVLKRYNQILINKLARYTTPEFFETYPLMKTKEKLSFIANLKADLDNAYIFKNNLNIKNNIMPVLKEIYSFLYIDNNAFSTKSYLRMLQELQKSEDSGIENAILEQELSKLEVAALQKIALELGKLKVQIRNKGIRQKIQIMLKTNRRGFIGCMIIFVIVASLMLYDYASDEDSEYAQDQSAVGNQDAGQVWLLRQNIDNPLAESAEFLRLADTCAAWTLINSLDTLSIQINTGVDYQFNILFPSAKDSLVSLDPETRERFELLCNLAVNYALNEYSKQSPYPINNYLDSVHIRLINDSTKFFFGEHDPYSNEITINDNSLQFGYGADAMITFATIAHETVHMLIQYNHPLFPSIKNYESRLNIMKSRRIPIDPKFVETYLQMLEQYSKDSEIEATKFDDYIFKTFFRGIFTENGKTIDISKSYIKDVLHYNPHNPDRQIKIIMDNLRWIDSLLPTLKIRIDSINSGKYASLKEHIYKMREYFMKTR